MSTAYYISASECSGGKDHQCLARRAVETNDLSYCDKSTSRPLGIYKCYEEITKISDMDVSSAANCDIVNEVFGGTTVCTPDEECVRGERGFTVSILQFNPNEICCLREGICVSK